MRADRDGVLIVAAAFGARGGLQGRLSRLAAHLVEQRPVGVLTFSPLARPRLSTRADGVLVVVVPSLLDWGRDQPAPLAALNTAFSLVTGLLGAWALRSRWRVAIGAGLQPEGVVACLAAVGGRRAVITTWLVGPLGNVERVRRSAARRGVVRVLRSACWFVPQTRDAAAELVDLGLPVERIRVLGAGVDLDRFRPREAQEPLSGSAPSATLRALYTGRFDLRQKRLDLLIAAWRRAELHGWELQLIGDGGDLPELRAMAAGAQDIRIEAWREDVAPALRGADLFVLPTVAETNAFSMLEPMACGLPGIVSATDGIVAREPAGVRLVENDVEAWVRALREVDRLGREGRRRDGERARAWAEAHADAAASDAAWDTLLATGTSAA